MLLKVLQRELVHKLRQFTPQGIENVLWAFATLGHHPGDICPQFTPSPLALYSCPAPVFLCLIDDRSGALLTVAIKQSSA